MLKSIMLVCAAVLSSILIAGCAPTATGAKYSELPLYKIYSEIDAKIVVFRPNSGAGSGEAVNIKIDGTIAGSVLKGGYDIFTLEPGKHTIQTESPIFDPKVTARLGRGETFFYKLIFENYGMTGAWKLVQLDERKVKKEFGNYRSSN